MYIIYMYNNKYIYTHNTHTHIYIYHIYRHQKTTSNNTKAFVHILVNFFSCVLT